MLIGMLFGLAIYNNINLDIAFPTVIFKKMLGFDGTFEARSDKIVFLYELFIISRTFKDFRKISADSKSAWFITNV